MLSGLIFCIGLINLIFLIEYPKQVGLEIREMGQVLDPSAVTTTSAQELENLAEGKEELLVEDNEDIKQMPFWSAVMIRGVLQFSFSYFFIKFAYYGVYYWVPSYL